MGMDDAFVPVEKNAIWLSACCGKRDPFPGSMHTLADIIAPPVVDKKASVREMAITMATYNIGAVAEESYTNGVTAFAGKAYMLADGFQKNDSPICLAPIMQVERRMDRPDSQLPQSNPRC